MDEEKQKLQTTKSYIYISALLLGALIMFTFAKNILGVKLVLLGIITLKAYGFLIRETAYEFWSCLVYAGILVYVIINYGGLGWS